MSDYIYTENDELVIENVHELNNRPTISII